MKLVCIVWLRNRLASGGGVKMMVGLILSNMGSAAALVRIPGWAADPGNPPLPTPRSHVSVPTQRSGRQWATEPGPVCSQIWQCTVQLGVRLAALPSRKLGGEVLWYLVKSQSGRYFSCQETPAHSLTELYSWMLPTAARTMLDRNVGLRLTYDVVLSSITSSASSTTTARSAPCQHPCGWVPTSEDHVLLQRAHAAWIVSRPVSGSQVQQVTWTDSLEATRKECAPDHLHPVPLALERCMALDGVKGAHGLWMTGRLRSPHLFKGACSSRRLQCPRSEGNCRPHAS